MPSKYHLCDDDNEALTFQVRTDFILTNTVRIKTNSFNDKFSEVVGKFARLRRKVFRF